MIAARFRAGRPGPSTHVRGRMHPFPRHDPTQATQHRSWLGPGGQPEPAAGARL